MEQEINAGYIITDRLTVGEYEFVIGERQEAPANYVTWQCKKDSREYFWGHYCSDRMAAVEDFCKRVLDEVRYMKQFRQEQHLEETVPTSKKSDRNHER